MRVRRSSDTISPILEQILYGGSSVSMNFLAIRQASPDLPPFFGAAGLNRVILFKYPNFDQSADDGDDFLRLDEDMRGDGGRPVETGIYIPNDEKQWNTGGVAIYLRSRNSLQLLEEYFGVTADRRTDGLNDPGLLSLIDDIPSLDAFLLKTCFEAKRIRVDPRYWNISPEEDRQLRRLIRRRIEPIVRKAIDSGSIETIERFLDAIWNPDLEEAGHFVSAFGIERFEADAIFSAWKGITYYEYQLRRIAPRVRAITAWLKSPDCIPADARLHQPYDQQLVMHIERISGLLNATLLEIRRILAEYEESFKALMAGQPAPFRTFLRKIQGRYWMLGYCVSALTSVVHLDNRCMKNNPSRHIGFEVMTTLLRQFEVALDRQREQRAVF